MAAPGLPVSTLIRTKENAEVKKPSRDQYRLAKELEEARKAGTVPAEQDEEGHDINPHIPHYIAAAPWYIGTQGPTLKHQRQPDQKVYAPITDWYKKGVQTTAAATKYRKGACENCGAMTHKKKDCLERPRKIGAKYSGDAIAPDEHVQGSMEHDFEGKRDRWNGYDPSEYAQVVEEYSKVEEAKKHLKAEKLHTDDVDEFGQDGLKPADEAEEPKTGDDALLDDDGNEDKYADDMEMPGTKVDSKQRITVRNLRIREDTAKYLINLDLSSAHYDPKTRSMREDPSQGNVATKPPSSFQGDNVIRYSGETDRIAKSQLFAWDAYEKGVDLHLQADPTKAAMLRKQYEEKKDEFKQNIEKNILAKYGGEEYLEAPPKELLLAQSESFVQYSRRGDVIRGAEKAVIRSRYEEDVLINNHTAVWGSYWDAGNWGYKCCHNFVKMSYCTGMAGILAKRAKEPTPEPVAAEEEAPPGVAPSGKRKRQSKEESSSSSSSSDSDSDSSSGSSSDSEEEKDEGKMSKKKLKAALEAQELQRKEAERLLALDERKRPYNSMTESKKLTKEEIEAYQLKKVHHDDPMSNFMKK
ncbi:Pre-mRNA-splicing factor SLU7 [Hypsibius exemplaris]|uniref:Pre-mRNA-splicing factor SLU7 n=1 Tax=Hypsibius exemplaris TaxID=2072580 RepID=A0A1W0WTV9_HYPEX|nr:Pre-mRNA-splicing factor SLU7 [Hypsibius exemplaris]